MAFYRKIVIDGEEYGYHIGMGDVKLKLPNGKTKLVDLPDIVGMSHPDIERGQWKKTFKVTPQMIKDYIVKSKHTPV